MDLPTLDMRRDHRVRHNSPTSQVDTLLRSLNFPKVKFFTTRKSSSNTTDLSSHELRRHLTDSVECSTPGVAHELPARGPGGLK